MIRRKLPMSCSVKGELEIARKVKENQGQKQKKRVSKAKYHPAKYSIKEGFKNPIACQNRGLASGG
ncbi:MAG: hypothetical protein ABIG63_19780 [Chloroflexota bacterium]